MDWSVLIVTVHAVMSIFDVPCAPMCIHYITYSFEKARVCPLDYCEQGHLTDLMLDTRARV